MKKGILFAAAILYLAVLPLSGCTRADGGPAISDGTAAQMFDSPQYGWKEHTGEKLVIWAKEQEADRIYMKRALERYSELTGDELELVRVPGTEYEEKLTKAFSGDGEKPDVILNYGGANIEGLNPDKNFYDFTDAVWVDDLTGTSINQTIYNGKVIGLPHWEASISGTLYNKKIFKKHGIEVPKTQEEFMKVCERLMEKGVNPVFMPCGDISTMLYQFPLDTLVEDSEVLDLLNSGRLDYADMPGFVQVVEWYKTMADKGYLGPDYENGGWGNMDDALRSGKYAMMLCWDTWLYTDYSGDASDFGLMPAFMGVPEKGTFEGPNLALLMVNKNSHRLETALNFITFMADPYNYNAAFEGIYTAPVFENQVASISTPQYIEAERLIERNYRDSTAWLRIRGFSQMDASCILDYMLSTDGSTAIQCLQRMDSLRKGRLPAEENGTE